MPGHENALHLLLLENASQALRRNVGGSSWRQKRPLLSGIIAVHRKCITCFTKERLQFRLPKRWNVSSCRVGEVYSVAFFKDHFPLKVYATSSISFYLAFRFSDCELLFFPNVLSGIANGGSLTLFFFFSVFSLAMKKTRWHSGKRAGFISLTFSLGGKSSASIYSSN